MDTLVEFFISFFDFVEKHSKAGTVIVGLVAVWVAIRAIQTKRRTTREVASIDFINDLSSDEHLARGLELLREASHYGKDLARLAKNEVSGFNVGFEQEYRYPALKNKKNDDYQDYLAILRLLNYFENMAIGARIGILDTKTLRMSRRKQIIKTWRLLEGFVEELRNDGSEYNPCIYEHFEWLKNCMTCKSRFVMCRPCKCNWLKCTWLRRFTRRCPCKD